MNWVLILCVFLSFFLVESRRWCSNDVDVILVLDESGSVSEQNFKNYVIPFSKTFSEELHSFHESSHIGVIKYSTVQSFFSKQEYCIGATKYAHFPDVKLVHPLDGNFDGLIRDISRMKYAGGFTPTGHAIKEAINEIVRHGREDVSKFVILVTDGDPRCDVHGGTKDSDPSFAFEQANSLKSRDDSALIIVEVGTQVRHGIDVEMASKMHDGNSFVFGVDDYQSLLKIVATVLEETCFEVEQIFPNRTCNDTSDRFSFGVGGNALVGDQATCRLVLRGPDGKDTNKVWEGLGEIKDIQEITCTFETDDGTPTPQMGDYSLYISFDEGEFLDTELVHTICYCPKVNPIDPLDTDEDIAIPVGTFPYAAVIVPTFGTLFLCCLLLSLIFLLLMILILCYCCQFDFVQKLKRVDSSENEILKQPLSSTVDEPDLEPDLGREDLILEDGVNEMPEPPKQFPQYYINGRPVNVDWGNGLSLDTPFRGSNMGMGENFSKVGKDDVVLGNDKRVSSTSSSSSQSTEKRLDNNESSLDEKSEEDSPGGNEIEIIVSGDVQE